MNKISTCAVAFATLIGLTACAQSKANVQTSADKDAAKLSKDGYTAVHDIGQARLAIYNAQPAQAKTFTDEALTAFEKASSPWRKCLY